MGEPTAAYLAAFRGEHLERALREWAADSRERESWSDADKGTYKYRAHVLEGALAEIAELKAGRAPLSPEIREALGIALAVLDRESGTFTPRLPAPNHYTKAATEIRSFLLVSTEGQK